MSSENNPSPSTGTERFTEQTRSVMAARRALPAPAAAMAAIVPGGLYGTDGANLYLIDTATGAASLIGPHGPVEFAIGALAFADSGVLYGISLTEAAQLYQIHVTSGAASAIGPLGIGFIFEGGLTFDAAGRLIGVDQGDDARATTFEIDTATGAATIIGPPGGQARDINGLTRDGAVVYGIDRPSNSLGRLDVATGSYAQIGLTGATIGDTGGLELRAHGRRHAAAPGSRLDLSDGSGEHRDDIVAVADAPPLPRGTTASARLALAWSNHRLLLCKAGTQ